MTIPYNVSRLQALKYLGEEFEFDQEETNNFESDTDNLKESKINKGLKKRRNIT